MVLGDGMKSASADMGSHAREDDERVRRVNTLGVFGVEALVREAAMSGRSSVVEFQPSKLAVVGSNPIARSKPSMLDLEPVGLSSATG